MRQKGQNGDHSLTPSLQALADHVLGLETTVWMGGELEPTVHRSDPLLSISITMSSQPGSSPQLLHRDDKNHHARHVAATHYSRGRDVLLGLFVPTCDTHVANGATRIVPGSHLWGDDRPDFGPTGDVGVVDAELRRGEAFVMLGSLYHGAGRYSLATGCRTVHIMFMCSGVHRQEVRWFLYGSGNKRPTVLMCILHSVGNSVSQLPHR